MHVWFVSGSGREATDTGANYYLPFLDLEGEHALSAEQLAEAQSDEVAARHRVVVYMDYEPTDGPIPAETRLAVFGATMRHELDHARQQSVCGNDVFHFDHEIVDHILRVKFGGLPRSAAYYNVKPMELDANSAAAMFLRAHHADQIDPPSCTPPPRKDRGTRQGFGFAGWLRTYSQEAAEVWNELEAQAKESGGNEA